MLIPIILYHAVVAGGDPFSVHPTVFRQQIDAVRDSDRTPLTVSGLAAALTGSVPLPARPVVVTFDDGTADFADTALPYLLTAGLPATLYVTTAQIGRPGMLSWQDVGQIAAGGVEVGAHSRNHPHLDTVRRQRLQREIGQSRSDVEQHLGEPCRSFAYPHGSYTRTVRDLVAAAGFTSAVAVRNAFSHEADDIFALARLTVRRDAAPEKVADWLTGAGARRSEPHELLRTTVFRQVRRARALVRPVPEVIP
jgi:peptidoglycan/xylan/chitin deacetylase (PgdA/CDA1 family)